MLDVHPTSWFCQWSVSWRCLLQLLVREALRKKLGDLEDRNDTELDCKTLLKLAATSPAQAVWNTKLEIAESQASGSKMLWGTPGPTGACFAQDELDAVTEAKARLGVPCIVCRAMCLHLLALCRYVRSITRPVVYRGRAGEPG